MARSLTAVATRDDRAEFEEIKGFYRRRLTAKVELPEFRWEPVRIGPTWQTDGGFWVLPDLSLGWEMLAWSGAYLQAGRDEPWVWTDEQARFLLWWYAVDDNGRFLYRDGVLQRLKGFGKDPIGAGIAEFEHVGPNVVRDFGPDGQPVGEPHPDPWVQIAAVSLEQTKNTMRLLPSMVSPRAVEEYGLVIGKESAYSGNRFLQAVTSSPATLQGARSTFVLLNETHEWVASNGGHEMEYVLQNNSTKSKGGVARTLRITNAYEPGADSVAEHDREAWEAVQAGRAADTGLLYDSLEAAPDAPLTIDAAPDVVRSVRGDSTWLDIDRIVQSIADVRNPPSASRRFWYNQIVAAEDAWLAPQEFDLCAAKDREVEPGERVFLFGDGSKSDDATALVGCCESDGHVFTVGVWQRPPRADGWTVDREKVARRVDETHERFAVVGFWFDPSDARDDETGERFWEPYADAWARQYGASYELHAVKSGPRKHAVLWDMRQSSNVEQFTEHAERFTSDVVDRRLTHDGGALLVQHVRNARRRPNRWGVSLGKEHRESRRKIDAAVCAVGARMMRHVAALADTKKPRSGKVW